MDTTRFFAIECEFVVGSIVVHVERAHALLLLLSL